jgi:hypothetical protein
MLPACIRKPRSTRGNKDETNNPNKRMHRTRYRAPVMLNVGLREAKRRKEANANGEDTDIHSDRNDRLLAC